jgi:hypothetical protein
MRVQTICIERTTTMNAKIALKRLSLLLAGATWLLVNPALASPGESGTVHVGFTKCPASMPEDAPAGTVFVYAGPVKGAVKGDLVVFGLPGAFDQVEGRTYLEANYEVTATDGSGRSFTAHVGGRMNNDGSMRAILYGFVSEGWLRGAQVVDKFAATDAVSGCVKGTLAITPKWASAHDDDED